MISWVAIRRSYHLIAGSKSRSNSAGFDFAQASEHYRIPRQNAVALLRQEAQNIP